MAVDQLMPLRLPSSSWAAAPTSIPNSMIAMMSMP